uniref:MyoD family inhibitor domain containing n=1 Tax=Cyprinus carpio TaxID=7962 RepID=A0A8C2CXT1_CYPCA
MSSETIVPPEGPEGPKKQLQEETNPLLSKSTDKCNTCTDESSDATETSQTPMPGDATSDGQDHMSESHTYDDLVRTQPQPLAQLTTFQQHGIDGEAARQQNSLHTVLSNGHGTPRGVTQTPSTSPTSESRKHPSPVSHRVQRKLRSSLSVNSNNSRRSKSSSSGSNKPGSSPEEATCQADRYDLLHCHRSVVFMPASDCCIAGRRKGLKGNFTGVRNVHLQPALAGRKRLCPSTTLIIAAHPVVFHGKLVHSFIHLK